MLTKVNTESASERRRADVMLDQTLAMLTPLVRLLVRNGVTYPQLVGVLKGVFLRAAHEELSESGKRVSDSAISIVSGVHRKDVRALRPDKNPASRAELAMSLAGEVIDRWTTDQRYTSEDGSPRPLPLRNGSSEQPSFEQLMQSVSRDLHSRAVLDELLRLGAVEVVNDVAHLRAERLVADMSFVDAINETGRDVNSRLAALEGSLRRR
ncbi:MAG: DUF6502 family protein [Burkholderiaceae bacterium]